MRERRWGEDAGHLVEDAIVGQDGGRGTGRHSGDGEGGDGGRGGIGGSGVFAEADLGKIGRRRRRGEVHVLLVVVGHGATGCGGRLGAVDVIIESRCGQGEY